jgi:hypothetical protein
LNVPLSGLISGWQFDIEVLSGLLDAFFLLTGPVSFFLFGVIVAVVDIVIDMLGGALHCDLLLQLGFFLLLPGRIVLLILQIDDIEVPAAVQLPLWVLFGKDDVAILQAIIAKLLSVDQIIKVSDGRVVFLLFGGRRLFGGVA